MHDGKIAGIAAGAVDRRQTNGSRRLYKYMVQKGRALPVPMTMVMTPLRARRFARRCKVVHELWPVMHLRDWMRVSFEEPYVGKVFLGGHGLTELQKAEDLLQQFWDRHVFADGHMPPNARRTIPIYLHGDEGRGQGKRPVEIIAFQAILPWCGEAHTNLQKSLG